jgi:betaine-aldehyde dehydrogenase
MATLFRCGDDLNVINGERRRGGGDELVDENPATSEVLTAFRAADSTDLDEAVAGARAAQSAWAALAPVERGRILKRTAELLRERNDDLARWEVADTGKPWREAVTVDVLSAADALEYYGGLVAAAPGEHHQLGGLMAYTRREPLGVIGAVGAWNYPIQIAAWKAAPALAAGNTMVTKPSELTPLTTVALAEALSDAGAPSGVFQVIQGAGDVGASLCAHPGVDALTLTGSVPTGRAVMGAAALGPKPVILELGGKSPLIVCDDADVDRAVTAAVIANFATQGEVCTNGTRVFVHDSLHDTFTERFVAAAEALCVGDPTDPATQVGSLISDAHLDKVLTAIASGRADGATVATGGGRLTDGALARGRFVAPTVFTGVTDDMAIATEEIFGPVASVLTFSSDDEVVTRANASAYGLAAGIITRDLARAHTLAARLDAGVVWVNTYNVTPVEVPFGGVRASGIGRENGLAGLDAVTRTKTVIIDSAPLEGL